jgi:hypothetical protein
MGAQKVAMRPPRLFDTDLSVTLGYVPAGFESPHDYPHAEFI